MVFMLAVLALAAIGFNPGFVKTAQVEDTMILATTTSTQDSGLLDVLIPAFEKKFGTRVKVIAVGTGQALEMGQRGDADVLLVHSRAAEDKFMADGYGSVRKDVMHNQFLLVGPASDPAKIKGNSDAVGAFKKIAGTKAKFISRGDQSGTHKKELELWKKAGVTPGGKWYVEAGQGMGDTLMMASEMGAYTLTDEATWLTLEPKLQLQEILKGDKALFNPYGVIAVNPEKFPNVHRAAARAFVDYITSAEGQTIIYNFGRDKYGRSLFIPDAIPVSQLINAAQTQRDIPESAVKSITIYKVAAKTAVVRSGPGLKYKKIGYLKKGTVLTVTGSKGEWLKIKYKNKSGYVARRLVIASTVHKANQ